MSVIAEVVVITAESEPAGFKALNDELVAIDSERSQQFLPIDMTAAGGTKAFCADVWAGAFNHLSPSQIEDAICAAPWEHPERVVVVINPYDYREDPKTATVTELRKQLVGS
ncbi:MAG: hypothetical protein WBM00_01765 [Solirubrobacterales bacterium]